MTDSSDLNLWERPPDEGPGLARPLLLSTLVHVVALLAFVSFNSQTRIPVALPESVAIQLRIRAPLSVAPIPVGAGPAREEFEQTVDAGINLESDVEVELGVDSGVDSGRNGSIDSGSTTRVDRRQGPPPQITSPVTPLTSPERPTLRMLTPESLRETLDDIAQEQINNDAWIVCTPRQEQSRIINCGEAEDARDFSVVERNATYDFFTRQEAPTSRTQRTIGYMVSRADDIEQQLLAADIGGQAVDLFLRELRSTALDISRTGNVQLETLRDQVHSNDSTYQQKERAFNPR